MTTEQQARIARITDAKLSPKKRLAKIATIRHGRDDDEKFVFVQGRLIGTLVRETYCAGSIAWKGYGPKDIYIVYNSARFGAVSDLIVKFNEQTGSDSRLFNEWITGVKTRLGLGV